MKNRGLKYSLILHAAVFLVLYFGVPYMDMEMNKDIVVSVEIAPISELSNLQNYAVHDKKETKPSKSEEVKPQATAQDRSVEKKEQDEESLKQKKKEQKDKDKEKKKAEKKKADKKTKSELESLLKNLEEESVKSDADKVKKPTKQNNASDNKSMSNRQFDETMPLSMTEKDAIKAQIERKFSNPVAMQFNPGELVVNIRFTLNADGTVLNASPMSSSTYPAQYTNAYHSISEGLIRAAYSASPLQGITRGDEIILTFDAYYLMNN